MIISLIPNLFATTEAKNILVIQSYRYDDVWADEINQGIKTCFRKQGININIHTCYLDARKLNYDHELSFMNQTCTFYQNKKIDLILVFDDEATYSLLKTEHPLTYSIPIVFSGVDYPNEELISKHKNVTGITNKQNFKRILDFATDIFPNRKMIYFLTDETILGKLSYNNFLNTWKEWQMHHPGYKLKEMNENKIPSKEFLWYLEMPHKADSAITFIGKWSVFYGGYSRMAATPFFGMNNEGMNNGILGVYSQTGYQQAYDATLLAVQLLKGKSIKNIPIITYDSPQLIIDWNLMQRYHLSTQMIPTHSILLNRPFIDKYKIEFIIGIFILFLIIALFIFHILKLYRKEYKARMMAQAKLIAQSELINERNRFNNALKSIKEGVISINNKLEIKTINLSAIRYLNLENSDKNSYLKKNINEYFKILSNDNHNILEDLIKRTIELNDTIHIPEGLFLKKNNNKGYFPISGYISVIETNGNRTGIVITFHDISEEQTQQEYYALTLRSGNISPWEYNVQDDDFRWGNSFREYVGWDENPEKRITREEFFSIIHPDDIQRTANELDNIISKRKKNFHTQFRIKKSSGGYEWWEFRCSSISGYKDDQPYKIIGICLNIQSFKQTEKELRESRDKAQESDKLKSAFLANISHEIRTPLNAIVGFSSLLTSDMELNKEDRDTFLETIDKNSQLLLKLITDVIEISRIESGETIFDDETFDAQTFISNIASSYLIQPNPEIKIVTDIPESKVSLTGDLTRLTQVINNIINNAIKFTTKGNITIGYYVKENNICFFVKDTGKGIPEEKLNQIFERFYKVDDFIQGVGLGLTLCKLIVEKYHGEIRVESEEGKGSCFTVILPAT